MARVYCIRRHFCIAGVFHSKPYILIDLLLSKNCFSFDGLVCLYRWCMGARVCAGERREAECCVCGRHECVGHCGAGTIASRIALPFLSGRMCIGVQECDSMIRVAHFQCLWPIMILEWILLCFIYLFILFYVVNEPVCKTNFHQRRNKALSLTMHDHMFKSTCKWEWELLIWYIFLT